jgi:hypothetical protein
MPDGSAVGNIGVHDPFELIRHLARSQSDPRKAVAELVQNALDEQAAHITIERSRDAGETVLSILDDGLGVLPELPRKDALTTIATNIGHSRKRQLSFDERMRQAMLGQYGIGLLGFWAVGHELRILSCVGGSEVWGLTLFEDSPRYTITRMPDVIGRPATWTEVQVRRLHRAALAPTVGGRLATYLSVELRGQLVRHGTELKLVDRIARGAADKLVVIKPSHLAGERLPGFEPIRLPDFKFPIEVTLHFAGDAGPDAGRVRLGCAGAVVLDDLASLPELAHPPWTDERLVGVVDFPHLEVAPGSRRGIVPNAAASALIDALVAIEPVVAARLEERSNAEAASLSEDMHRQLARLFTRVTNFVPHLEWFPVSKRSGTVDDAPSSGSAVSSPSDPAPPAEAEGEPAEQPELFPPGPLFAVTVRPSKLELGVQERKELHAVAADEHGRAIREGVTFEWKASSALSLAAAGNLATIEALSPSATESVEVLARQGERERVFIVPVRIVSEHHRRADAGIPQPEEVNEPLQSWRSRLTENRWQVNTGHPDYRAFAHEARPRLRYLAMLLSKEVVTRNFPQPGVGSTLEELVGLLAALERSGAWRGRARDDEEHGSTS